MTYSCPDCGVALTGAVRELELEEGETAKVLESGSVVISKAVCSNGCSAEAEQKPKRKQKRTPAADADGELCARSDECSKPNGHMGRCNRKRGEEGAEE